MNRRHFIKQTAFTGAALATSAIAGKEVLQAQALSSNGGILGVESIPEQSLLTILHTNDVHSRLEPFPMDGGRNQGLGGVAARASIIQSVREENPATLLLDAGDIFQGTPYFNLYKGEPEIKAMAKMGYDAVVS